MSITGGVLIDVLILPLYSKIYFYYKKYILIYTAISVSLPIAIIFLAPRCLHHEIQVNGLLDIICSLS